MRRRRFLSLVGLTLLIAAAAPSPLRAKRIHPAVPQVNLVRLEGQLRAPQRTDRGTTDLRLAHAGKTYRFQLTRLRILSGPSILAADVLVRVAPYRPNFFLAGADTMIQRLNAVRPDASVGITAYLRRGSRQLLVTEITVGPPPTASVRATPSPTH